jgi:hypothetical protein
MFEDTEYVGALDVVLDARRQQGRTEDEAQRRLDESRRRVDDARTALAELAEPAVGLISYVLAGKVNDDNGVRITEDRIDMALTVLDRVGIPKLRATAISASIAHAPSSPAPGSPGWEPPQVEDGDEEAELDVGSVDAQISAFLEGAHAARDLRGEK